MSYPANKIIFAPINEPYGTQDTTVGTQAERYTNFAEIMRAANDSAYGINSSIRIMGFLDNDPDMSFTKDFFLQNSTWKSYFDILAANTYLHSDWSDDDLKAEDTELFGYSAWNNSGWIRSNLYNREWELTVMKRPGRMAEYYWDTIIGSDQNITEIWQGETADKFLAHNNATGSGQSIKIFNTTNDALWWAARLSLTSRERWNSTTLWAMLPLWSANATVGGWGFMYDYHGSEDVSEPAWQKYEAYNVMKMYNRYALGKVAINNTNLTLENNSIFTSYFLNSSGNEYSVFITNHRTKSVTLNININNLDFVPNNIKTYSNLNGTLLRSSSMNNTNISINVETNSSIMVLLEITQENITVIVNSVSLQTSLTASKSQTCSSTRGYSDIAIPLFGLALMILGFSVIIITLRSNSLTLTVLITAITTSISGFALLLVGNYLLYAIYTVTC